MSVRSGSWKLRLLATAPLAALSLGALPAPAAAQTTANEPSALEEVVVVARKREESLQSVPVAVSAVQGEGMQRQGVREPSDLTRLVPSLTITGNNPSTPTGAVINLRGQVASDVLLTLSQPVGYYEDSVNIPHPVGSNVAFFDVDRVEVLKGPQGTLYGRNTTGGAVNVLTRNADYSGLHGFVYLEGGNHGDLKYSGAINVPIVEDKLSARLAYQHWDREGYGRSAITGQRLGGDRDDDVARLSVALNPTNYFTANFKLEYFKADRADALYQTRQITNTTLADLEWQLQGAKGGVRPSQLVANTTDLFTNYSQLKGHEELEGYHAVADMSWDITDAITLRSISGYHEYEDFRTFDLDGMPLVVVEVGAYTPPVGVDPRPVGPDQKSTFTSQEFNLSGSTFDDRFDWLVGAYYAYDKGLGAQRTSIYPPVIAAITPPPGGLGFPASAQYNSLDVRNQSWALFTQNDFKFTDIVSITLGARYTEERLKQEVAATLFNLSTTPVAARYACISGPSGVFVAERGCLINQSAVFSGTSYLASLNLQFTPETLVYLKTARGFRGGALQVRAPTFPAAQPEIATDYEIGVKSDFFDNRLRTNLAIYQTNYENKQETAIIVLNGVQSTPIQNAASARIRGAELEVVAAPIHGLTITGAGTYLYGQYQDYPRAVTPAGIVNASGAQFALPRWTYNIGARYVLENVGPGDLGFQANYSWRDKIPTTVLNNDPNLSRALQNEWRQDRGLLSASIDYVLPEYGVTLTAFATNLTNEEYQTQGLTFNSASLPYGYTGVTQEPRMYGFSIKKTFGDE